MGHVDGTMAQLDNYEVFNSSLFSQSLICNLCYMVKQLGKIVEGYYGSPVPPVLGRVD